MCNGEDATALGRAAKQAIEKLKRNYKRYPWTYEPRERDGGYPLLRWPGTDDESIMVVAHQSDGVDEQLHRHDYFYFNYVYRGSFFTHVSEEKEPILVSEGMLCAGQPFSLHAMGARHDDETTIIGILMKTKTVHERILPLISPSAALLGFLVGPATDAYSDRLLCLSIRDVGQIRSILEMMTIEYAEGDLSSQDVLLPLAVSFLSLVSREASVEGLIQDDATGPVDRIVQYIREHPDTATLTSVAHAFGYSPTYLSGLLKNSTGRTFSAILAKERMTRASLLLRGTDLPVEKIASLLGYTSTSSFYRAHRQFYGTTPSSWRAKQ